MNKLRYVLVLIFLAGAIIRGIDAFRPINTLSWRESDIGSIARNFVNEGMNPLYPRIDWRGNTPGFTESEFPLYAWLIAICYQAFGEYDFIGRVLAFLFSLVSMYFFIRLAREYLDDLPLLIAVCFFTFNPLFIELSTQLKAEGMMFVFYIAAVFYFKKWIDVESTKDFIVAVVTMALCILCKLTSAHIGLLFAFLLFQKYGWEVLKQSKVWVFGVLSLLPAILWYMHAKNLWLAYGNSLGISNETHLAGWDFFTNSYFIKGILNAEIWAIWTPFGLMLGMIALIFCWRYKLVRFCIVWFAGIFTFYIIAARTTADGWATYYHIFSLPAAALLFGLGFKKVIELADERKGIVRLALVGFLLFIVGGVSLLNAKKVRADILEKRVENEHIACAHEFEPLMQKPGLILVSGNTCFDDTGYPVAYNASYMFYWLRRHGFNICVEDQSPEQVREYARQGAVYFIAEKERMELKPGFEQELRKKYKVIAECKAAILFDISE